MKRLKKENILISGMMLILSFIFLLKSPLNPYPWLRGQSGTDSSVFRTVALMMEKGYMPYRDSFDHKGPVLYIIQYIGNMISKDWGIWVVEFLLMTVTFFLIYKISRLSCGIVSSMIVFLLSVWLLFDYFQGGNLSEEYAMPMIALATYIFLDYFIYDKINNIRLILCGFTLGIVLLLRPNMISVWAFFCVYIVVDLIRKKEWEILGKDILFFTAGMLLIILPIVIWLIGNHALTACYEDYIVFNSQYVSDKNWIKKLSACFTFCNTGIFMLAFGIMLYESGRKDRKVNVLYLVYMVVSLIFTGMSGASYQHYGMVLIPVFAYPLSLLFAKLEEAEVRKAEKWGITVVSVCLLSIFIMPGLIEEIYSFKSIYENRNRNHEPEEAVIIKDIVCNVTNEDDSVSVYGNWDYIYILCNRKHATKYSYQDPIGSVMPEIMEEYYMQLAEEQPKAIIIQSQFYDERIAEFLQNNHYTLAWSQNGESLDGASVFTK